MFGIGLDVIDIMKGVILLIVTSPLTYAILEQFDPAKLCTFARLLQGGLIFGLSFLFDSAFGVILSTIIFIIGLGNYIATNSSFAFLDPNLA